MTSQSARSNRQNGWPAGSTSTRTSSCGWCVGEARAQRLRSGHPGGQVGHADVEVRLHLLVARPGRPGRRHVVRPRAGRTARRRWASGARPTRVARPGPPSRAARGRRRRDPRGSELPSTVEERRNVGTDMDLTVGSRKSFGEGCRIQAGFVRGVDEGPGRGPTNRRRSDDPVPARPCTTPPRTWPRWTRYRRRCSRSSRPSTRSTTRLQAEGIWVFAGGLSPSRRPPRRQHRRRADRHRRPVRRVQGVPRRLLDHRGARPRRRPQVGRRGLEGLRRQGRGPSVPGGALSA